MLSLGSMLKMCVCVCVCKGGNRLADYLEDHQMLSLVRSEFSALKRN